MSAVMMFGADLATHLASTRWEAETSGITVSIGGVAVPLSTKRGDDRAALQATYDAIRDGLRPDPAAFKFADDVPRQATNGEMRAAILAALGFVQACFEAEALVRKRIEDGSLVTTPQVDEAFTRVLAVLTTPT